MNVRLGRTLVVVAAIVSVAGIAASLLILHADDDGVRASDSFALPPRDDVGRHPAARFDHPRSSDGKDVSPRQEPDHFQESGVDNRGVIIASGQEEPAEAKRRDDRPDATGDSAIPNELLVRVREVSWGPASTALLKGYLTAMHDQDGDGVLSELERIRAVVAVRDAVWPEAVPVPSQASPSPGDQWQREVPVTSAAHGHADPVWRSLTRGELIILDSLREERRSRFVESGLDSVDPGLVALVENRRVSLLADLEVVDDGKLSGREAGIFFMHRSEGAIEADLDGNGEHQEDDILMFLYLVESLE